MKLDLTLVLRLFLFFVAMIALIMAYYAIQDAGYFCQEYCNCKYSTDSFSYRVGSCKCYGTPKNITINTTF